VAYDRTVPRRRSVFSGLLLILLGALFLLRNFHYGFPIWRILERWWPLLFIIWGVSKLYDRMVAQRTGETAPATISGGEVALIILLFFVIGGAGVLDWGSSHAGRGWDLPWEDSFTFPEEAPPVTVPANAQISIRADRGDINVYADDTPQIRVSTRKTAYGSNQNEAQNRAGRAHVSVNQTGNTYIVEPQETSSEGRPVRTDMEVHVPKGATLTVTTDNGGVQVTGTTSAVSIVDRHGDVEVHQAGSDVSVDASSDNVSVVGAAGDVRVTGRASHVEISDVRGSATTQGTFDSLRFEHVDKGVRFISNRTDLTVSQLNGRLELEGGGDLTLSDASGNVSLITKDRDITFENVMGHTHIENTSGGISLRFSQPPKEPIEISNRSGEISIELPAKAAFDIDARSDNGEIETEFDDASKVTTFQGNGVLVDSIGSKGPKIQLRTTYGTIHIRKTQ
jgi:Putative adhesin/Domain of unknown function (DUF5668)